MLVIRPSVTDDSVYISLPPELYSHYQNPWCKVFKRDQLLLAYFVLSALLNKSDKEQIGVSGHVIFWLNEDRYDSGGRVINMTFLSNDPANYTLSHKESLLLAKVLMDVFSEYSE